MARACMAIQVSLALMSLVCLLTFRDVQASAIREKDSPAIDLKSPSFAGDAAQAEPMETPAGNTSQIGSLNSTGGVDNSIDNGLITPIYHNPKAGSKFSRKKMWFARQLNEGVFVAGQLNPRQIKYAADSGFKSIVSVFTQPGERSPTGKRLVISTAEERKIVENLSGMKFFTVLEADEFNDWSNVTVVEKMSRVYPQLEFPALLHCAKGVTVVLATLLHYANQTVHDPLFEPRVDSERFYYIARKLGLDFVETLSVTRNTVKEITGEDMPDSAVKPNGTVLYNYWQAYPVYDGIYIAGQIQQRDLQTIKSVGISTIVNIRSGLSTNGKPSQETVELINIKSGTPTYATSHVSSRQSKRALQRSIIDPNKLNTYIGKNSNVNYESRNPSEFGDNIGYNELIERASIRSAGVDYAHMPLVAMTEFREFFKNNKDKLMEIGKKGPVLIHCTAARRAAKVAVLAAALQYNLPFDWALQRLKELGFGISAETEPETYNVYKDYLSTDRVEL